MSNMMDSLGEEPPPENPAQRLARVAQHHLDKTIIWIKVRWGAFLFVLSLYGLRVYLIQGFCIVSYGLGIYLLNLLIGFLSPAVDPETEGNTLPTVNSEEYRPFNRKLPEFKFWAAAFRAVCASLFMTFFGMFDLPVFWPILLAYFILLVFLTLKDRIKHMYKYQYVPFAMGKKQTYGELTKEGRLQAGGG